MIREVRVSETSHLLGFPPEEGILGNQENLIKSCNDLKDTDENERCRPT